MSWNVALRSSLLCLLFTTSLFPISSWDIFWHLRVARDMLSTLSFPHGDIYSFSRPGGMYVEDEWVFQAASYLVHRALGWNGLIAAKVLLVVLAGTLLYLEARVLATSPALAALIVGLCAMGARTRMLERPDTLNLFFFPAMFVILSAYRRTGIRRFLYLLPPLFGVWGNCHSGVTLGLVALLAMAGADVVCRLSRGILPESSAGNPWHLALAALLSLAAAVVNPIGPFILVFPFEAVQIHRTIEWVPAPVADFPLFYALGAAFLVLSLIGIRSFDLGEMGSYACLLALGIRHVRMVGIFAFAVALPLARLLGTVVAWTLPLPRSGWAREAWRHRIYAVVCATLLGSAAYYARLNRYHALGVGLERSYYPEGAADFILRERPPGEMWNEFTFGGYLIYRLYPTYKVFIDNREEPYYDLLDEIHRALYAKDGSPKPPDDFARHLDKYRINFAVLRYNEKALLVPGPDGKLWPRAWSAVYFPLDVWALVYWDDVAMVVVRRSAADPAWLARLDQGRFRPDDWRILRRRLQGGGDKG